MSEFNIIVYYGKKVTEIVPFNDFMAASQYMVKQQKLTNKLKFYLVQTIAFGNSEAKND